MLDSDSIGHCCDSNKFSHVRDTSRSYIDYQSFIMKLHLLVIILHRNQIAFEYKTSVHYALTLGMSYCLMSPYLLM